MIVFVIERRERNCILYMYVGLSGISIPIAVLFPNHFDTFGMCGVHVLNMLSAEML